MADEAPAQGEDFSAIAKDFQDKILPGITHWQHGRFFAYFPSISTFESMLAELYSASVSNPGFNVRYDRYFTLQSSPRTSTAERRRFREMFLTNSGYAPQLAQSWSK